MAPPDRDAPVWRNLLLLIAALLLAGQGSALAAHKKKHRAKRAHPSAPAKSEGGDTEPGTDTEDAPQPTPERAGDAAAASNDQPPAERPADEDGDAPAQTSRRAPAPVPATEPGAGAPRLPPALQAGVRVGGLYRRLSWTQVSSGTLSSYAISASPEVGLRVEFYPAALVGRDFGANVGAIVAFDRAVGANTHGPSGDVSTIFQNFLLGAKVRFPVGPLFVPYASVAYGGDAFLFSPRLASVPSVFYTFVRLGAGARLQLGSAVDVDVSAGFLPVIDAGKQSGYLQSTDYFPAMSSHALDAAGSLGVRVGRLFGLRGGADFRQYALNTSGAAGMFAAQGGTDRFVTPWLMVEIVLDGAGPQGGGPED